MIEPVRGELAHFQERRTGIKQPLDPVAGQQLAACRVLGARALRSPLRGDGDLLAQRLSQGVIMHSIGAKLIALPR